MDNNQFGASPNPTPNPTPQPQQPVQQPAQQPVQQPAQQPVQPPVQRPVQPQYQPPQGGYVPPQQPQYQAPQQPYTKPADPPETPMTVGQWLVTLLVLAIPCVNIIMLFVWGFGDGNKGRANFCKAYLIWIAICIGLGILLSILLGAWISSLIGNLSNLPNFSGYGNYSYYWSAITSLFH